MALDLVQFSAKLKSLREQFGVSLEDLSRGTGIPSAVVTALDDGAREPTGDQVLILADFFKCDFKHFVSNEMQSAFDQSEKLFRRLGDRITTKDRWAIQEFMHLCECERDLDSLLGRSLPRLPGVTLRGNYWKGQGQRAAAAVRSTLALPPTAAPRSAFDQARQLGVRLFRRRLQNSDLSGLYIAHPTAGPCVLVNYDDDPFRQRFTAAHELAHAVVDADKGIVVSAKWTATELTEVRANSFASAFLLPPALLGQLPNPNAWTEAELIQWAVKFFVNVEPLVFALSDAGRLSARAKHRLLKFRVPAAKKQDVELPESLTPAQRQRRESLLEHGLSVRYVGTVFEAYRQGLITAGRAAETLLTSSDKLSELAAAFGEQLPHDD